MSRKSLARFHELVLRAVLHLGPGCTVEAVRSLLAADFAYPAAFGAVFTTLDRLEAKGMVSRTRGESTPRRGGRGPRLYAIEPHGRDALRDLDVLASSVAALPGIGPPGPA